MLTWFRRRRLAARLAQADADALLRDHGAAAAYREARRRERDLVLPDGTTHAGRTPAHWRKVALIVARRAGHAVGPDTATRMLMDRRREMDGAKNPTRRNSPPDGAMTVEYRVQFLDRSGGIVGEFFGREVGGRER
jgi:hypothetical protein